VTGTALKEIVTHLERVSRDAEEKMKVEATNLKERVHKDMAELAEQLEKFRLQRDGLNHENYKRLLELMLELEKKLGAGQKDALVQIRNDVAKIIEDQNRATGQTMKGNH